MVRCGTERERERETGVGERGYRCGRERERQGWERKEYVREKDKKKFRVGERKIGRETGVVETERRESERERERERKIKRETGAG